MNYIVFDVETTGLNAQAEVVQFAGLILGNDFNIKRVVNFFCCTQVPYEERAVSVTGLTPKVVRELSKGKFFEDYFFSSDIMKMKDLIWIGYNSISFDSRVINNTLVSNGLSRYDFGPPITRIGKRKGVYSFDVMTMLGNVSGGKKKSLVEARKSLSYSEHQLNSIYRKLASIAGIPSEKGSAHNALYDAMVTMLLFLQNRKWCM